MIDVLKTRLSSSVSNWYTDADGNLILESVNGASAMKLCGEGFMIASSRTDDGAWDWRTFGTGEGFTADMLITGFLSADRIRAGTITANKLAADVGETLDLSSNVGINLRVEGINANIDRLRAAAVSNVQVLYALGTSPSTPPIGGWSAEAPDWEDGKYMWQKTVTTYATGTTEDVQEQRRLHGAVRCDLSRVAADHGHHGVAQHLRLRGISAMELAADGRRSLRRHFRGRLASISQRIPVYPVRG